MLKFINRQYQKLRIYLSGRRARFLKEQREQFLAQTQTQSESDFLANCFQRPGEKEREVALGIRNAIAKLGEIDAQFIRSDASFESLNLLPFWDECGDVFFDTMLFIEFIGKEMGIQFSDRQLDSLSVADPDMNPQMKTRDFVRDFYRWYEKLEDN